LSEQVIRDVIGARRFAMAAGKSIPDLVGLMLLCEAAGRIGGTFSLKDVRDWHSKLEKPSFSAPSWVFGPMWPLLYAVMGVSLYVAER
jgi:translocator protein